MSPAHGTLYCYVMNSPLLEFVDISEIQICTLLLHIHAHSPVQSPNIIPHHSTVQLYPYHGNCDSQKMVATESQEGLFFNSVS